MARLDELAEAIVQTLRLSPVPEPLPVEMRGHTASDVAFFVRAVADASERLAAPLCRVKVDPEFGVKLLRSAAAEPLAGGAVQVKPAEGLGQTVKFCRFPKS